MFDDETSKYEKVAFAGVEGTEKTVSPRKYSYRISVNEKTYAYEQYILIKEGYVYILTFCCENENYDSNKAIFNSIAANFKFKN